MQELAGIEHKLRVYLKRGAEESARSLYSTLQDRNADVKSLQNELSQKGGDVQRLREELCESREAARRLRSELAETIQCLKAEAAELRHKLAVMRGDAEACRCAAAASLSYANQLSERCACVIPRCVMLLICVACCPQGHVIR